MVSTRIDIVGDAKGVQRMLMLVNLKLSPAALMGFLKASVEPYLKRRASERFATEGDDASGKWSPLSPVTQYIRQTSGFPPSHPINKRTGELEQYITQSSGEAVPFGTGAQLVYPNPTARPVLAKKVERAQRGDRRTPARPVLAVSPEDMLQVHTQLALYIQAGK